MKPLLLAAFGLSAAAAIAVASQAGAQTVATKPKAPAAAARPAAAPAAPAATAAAPAELTLTGAAPGICVLSREGLIQGSTVGAFVTDRLKQLGAVVQAEIAADQTSLQNDAKALEAKRATLTADVYAQQQQGLQQRLAALQQKAQQRNQEMQATEQKAVARVLQSAGPLVGQVTQQRGCGVLLDGNAVLVRNPSLDVTPAVITALNGVLTQFAFDREHLDPAPAAN